MPLVVEEIPAGIEFHTRTFNGVWDGEGDFIISFTGDIYIDKLSVTNHPLDDFKIEVGTRIEQTSERISLLGGRIDRIDNTITDLGIELNALDQKIRIWGQKTDANSTYLSELGINLDMLKEQLTIYGQNADSIKGTVTDMGIRLSAAEGKITTWIDLTDDLDGSLRSIESRMDIAELKFGNYVALEIFNETVEKHWTAIEQTEKDIMLSVNRATGYPIYKDFNFDSGENGISLFNNSSGSAVTLKRLAIHTGNVVPTATNHPASTWTTTALKREHVGDVYRNLSTGYSYVYTSAYLWEQSDPEFGTIPLDQQAVIRIQKTVGASTPGLGGFKWGNTGYAGGVFEARFTAKIPEGFFLEFEPGTPGKGYTSKWLTDNAGTGEWREYRHQVVCSSEGVGATNFFYLVPEDEDAVARTIEMSWYLLKATLFDLSGYEDPVTAINLSESEIKIKANKVSLEGHITANGNVQITEDGKIIAKDAQISGTITATQGEIGEFKINAQGLYYGDPSKWTSTSYHQDLAAITPGTVRVQKEIGYGTAGDVAHMKAAIGDGADPTIPSSVYCASAGYFYRKMNTLSETYQYTPAVKIISENVVNRNVALYVKGALVCDGGMAALGHLYNSDSYTEIEFTKGTTIVVSASSRRDIYLPSRARLQRLLGVTGTFCLPVRIVSKYNNSQSIYIHFPDNESTLCFLDFNGNKWVTYFGLGKGDVVEFLLIYDGTNYYAQVTHHRD